MKTAAVIAEFDPFHNGHAFLLEKARTLTGADSVVVLLSGDFVQRGLPASACRRSRAEMALRCGADLVLSYPVRFCTSSAETYASRAVEILTRLGVCDFLVFGSECGETAPLLEAARYFVSESADYREALRERLRNGDSYPAARAAASPFGSLLETPNNTLGIEYCKAILRTGSPLVPRTAERIPGISASAIREAAGTDRERETAERLMPGPAARILLREKERSGTVSADDLTVLLRDRLRRLQSAEDAAGYYEVPAPLASAIFRERNRCSSFSSFSEELKTKDRTLSAVRRALLHIALGIGKREAGETGLYTQILGFGKAGEEILGRIGKASSIPVVAKAADAERTLSPGALTLFREDTDACDLFEGIGALKAGRSAVPEIANPIVIV